ncbi:DUF1579 family protein [Thalassoglobus polymorphus]|nr:DUF1579 family protein [Thalassoglobus polymorphus]
MSRELLEAGIVSSYDRILTTPYSNRGRVMLQSRQLLFVIAILSSGTASLLAQDSKDFGQPSPNVPELKELARFSGEWEAQLNNSDLKIPSERKWVFNGYFLKHDFELPGGALRGTIYRGYNTRSNKYTMTFLDTQGNMSMLTGDWNDSLKTFTFEAVDSSSQVQKYESDFSAADTEQWTIVFDNTLMNQVTGVAKKLQN